MKSQASPTMILTTVRAVSRFFEFATSSCPTSGGSFSFSCFFSPIRSAS